MECLPPHPSQCRSDTLSQDPRALAGKCFALSPTLLSFMQGYMHYSNMHHPMHCRFMHRYIISPTYMEAHSTSQSLQNLSPDPVTHNVNDSTASGVYSTLHVISHSKRIATPPVWSTGFNSDEIWDLHCIFTSIFVPGKYLSRIWIQRDTERGFIPTKLISNCRVLRLDQVSAMDWKITCQESFDQPIVAPYIEASYRGDRLPPVELRCVKSHPETWILGLSAILRHDLVNIRLFAGEEHTKVWTDSWCQISDVQQQSTNTKAEYGADISFYRWYMLLVVTSSPASKFSNGIVLTISNLLRATPLFAKWRAIIKGSAFFW